MRPARLLILSCALLTAACGPQKAAEATVAPPYNVDMPMNEVMGHVMNPAAYQFWSGWGTIADSTGVHDLTPTTEEGWEKVENGAATVALTTNVLMLPGYARAPEAEWNRYAAEVAKIAVAGKAAAERKDGPALGEIGEKLDLACEACHMKFIPNIQ